MTKIALVKSLPSFTVDAKALREALELGTPEKKTTIPILVNALFELQGKTLRITTTDLDQAAVTEIDAVPSKHKKPIEPFTIPHRKTLDLLGGESGPVVFTPLENNLVKMTVGGVDYKLIGMAKTNYPQVAEPTEAQYNIPGETLTEMLAHTTFAISEEESRYTLNGALFVLNSGRLRIVATDGHRLATEVRDMDITTKDGTVNLLIPRPALAWLSKPKRIGKEFVGVSVGLNNKAEGQVFFHLPHLRTVFSTRKCTGQFPNWEAVMPRKENTRISADFDSTETLVRPLTRVAKFADERSGCVRFQFNGKVTLGAQSTEHGEAEANVPAVLNAATGEAIKIGLNSRYVLDVLKVIGKKPVSIHLIDHQSAAMLDSPEIPGFASILMSMRL